MCVRQQDSSSPTPRITRAIPTVLAALAVGSTLVAGCAGDMGFPTEIPQGPYVPWVDGPLAAEIDGELDRTRDVWLDFLEGSRTRGCETGAADSERRARHGARSRVDHALDRAASEAERSAMSQQQSELTPIVPYAEGSLAQRNRQTTMLGWQCGASVDDACMTTAAHAAVATIYARYFAHSRVSRAATAKVLPVLRRDLEWGLAHVESAESPKEAAALIERRCAAGESPLGNYLQEHAGDDDERLARLARRLGGTQPCANVAGMYRVGLSALEIHVRNWSSEPTCPTPAELEWAK
ncbi:hypothetical protein FIV42_22035 [Persicimonas caeni]|uniref:Uncharacterized protein n=1 Tax=Persicimonas caeni TaxID=2292766 RepID=A0A4Y6PYD4_PERCE|nr:hypothetical protein [Persicimonas caeni]QDG53326.1 hypothetical protein FIV42_22035 [Persicimonas caeni]QED34547.1 hypothetical protein FRD00_22030 [Persicimonas caeni]